jgi:choline dehydrogenase-like flavoprotein
VERTTPLGAITYHDETADAPVTQLDTANSRESGLYDDVEPQPRDFALAQLGEVDVLGRVMVTSRALVDEVTKNSAVFAAESLIDQGNTPAPASHQHRSARSRQLPEVARSAVRAEAHGRDRGRRHRAGEPLHRPAPGHALLFTQSPTMSSGPCDYQFTFSPLAFKIPDLASGDADESAHDVNEVVLHDRLAVNVIQCVLHPDGRGTITLRSSDPTERIRLEHEVVGQQRDLDRFVEACNMTRDLMRAPAMARHVLDERIPGPVVDSDDVMREFLRFGSWRGEHAVGTCRMGGDDASVVDPELRVRGIEGLRVVDASVFPTLTSGNTSAPVVMVAEKGSDLVLGKSEPASAPSHSGHGPN